MSHSFAHLHDSANPFAGLLSDRTIGKLPLFLGLSMKIGRFAGQSRQSEPQKFEPQRRRDAEKKDEEINPRMCTNEHEWEKKELNSDLIRAHSCSFVDESPAFSSPRLCVSAVQILRVHARFYMKPNANRSRRLINRS